jgi:hypothetical protein
VRFLDQGFAARSSTITGAIAVLLVCAAWPQEKDPFEYLRKDERLSPELTLRLTEEALKDTADVIEAATGVKISVDPDIAEDKVTIFCKGQPASEVMIQIAKLFGYHFRPERIAGELSYSLFRDDATRELERRLKRGAIDRVFAEIGEFVAECAKEAQTPEGFEKLRESLPSSVERVLSIDTTKEEPTAEELSAIEEYAAESKKVSFWGFCAVERGIPLLYSTLSQDQIETLKDEGRVVFASYGYPGAYPMPDAIASAFAQEPDASRVLPPAGAESKETLEERRSESGEERPPVLGARVEFKASVQEGQAESRELSLAASVWRLDEERRERLCGTYSVELPIGEDVADVIKRSYGAHRPASATPKAQGAPPSGLSDAMLQTIVELPISSAVKTRLGCPVAQEKAERHAQQQRESQVSKTSPAAIFREKGLLTMSHLIEDLAPQVPVSMIADHYDKPYTTPIEGETLGHALASMQGSGRDLTVDGEWLRLASKTWYLDRSAQIPNHLLLRWLNVEKQKGGFELGDLAEMALLGRDQLRSISAAEFGGVHEAFESLARTPIRPVDWKWIEALALCTDHQRNALLAGQAVAAAAMPRAAQQSLMEALQETAPGAPWESVARAALSISMDRTATRAVAAFHVASDDWSSSHELQLPAMPARNTGE